MSNGLRGILIVTLLVSGSPFVEAAVQANFNLLPFRTFIPFESAWEGMLETLETEEMETVSVNRTEGLIWTEVREYASGVLTEGHISKIGERPKLIDGQWLKVQYQYEIHLQLISSSETIVTVYAKIQALQREFLGKEYWVSIASNGNLEDRLLTQFGRLLFGQHFELERPKKGFWNRDPSYIPDPLGGRPDVVGPERR